MRIWQGPSRAMTARSVAHFHDWSVCPVSWNAPASTLGVGSRAGVPQMGRLPPPDGLLLAARYRAGQESYPHRGDNSLQLAVGVDFPHDPLYMPSSGVDAYHQPLRDRSRVETFPHQRQNLQFSPRQTCIRLAAEVGGLGGRQVAEQSSESDALGQELALGRGADRGENVGECTALAEEGCGARCGRAGEEIWRGVARQDQDLGARIRLFYPPGALDAVDSWQVDVHKDHVGVTCRHQGHGVVDGTDRAHALKVGLRVDSELERVRKRPLILDHQDLDLRRRLLGGIPKRVRLRQVPAVGRLEPGLGNALILLTQSPATERGNSTMGGSHNTDRAVSWIPPEGLRVARGALEQDAGAREMSDAAMNRVSGHPCQPLFRWPIVVLSSGVRTKTSSSSSARSRCGPRFDAS